jgi:hypothetical protein
MKDVEEVVSRHYKVMSGVYLTEKTGTFYIPFRNNSQ